MTASQDEQRNFDDYEPTPPSTSVSIAAHAMKCGAGTPSACRVVANASGPHCQFGEAIPHEAISNDEAERNESVTTYIDANQECAPPVNTGHFLLSTNLSHSFKAAEVRVR